MNTNMNGKKIRVFRARDDHGNPHDIRVGYRNIDNKADAGETVTEIFLAATHHGQFDKFHIVECFGDRQRLHQFHSIDFFEFDE